jgi:hypothetical protein
MNGRIITSLMLKDLKLFFRDRFFAVVTVLALVMYVGLYLVMPAEVEETYTIGFYAQEVPEEVASLVDFEGVKLKNVDDEDTLRRRVEEGEYAAGITLSEEFQQHVEAGQPASITLYLPANVPGEQQESISTLFSGMGYTAGGLTGNIQMNQEIIGQDRLGRQVAARDRMLPLFAVLVLVMETMGLANLITEEVENKTIRALLVTPMNLPELFIAKGTLGVLLAFGQVTIIMGLTGGLSEQPLLMLFTLLLGSLLVTGIGFIMAAIARNFISIAAWSIVFFLVLSLPAFSVMFPGTISDWVELIPTYYLVDTVHQVANFGAGWGEVTGNLVALAMLSSGFLALSVFILKRKMQTQ